MTYFPNLLFQYECACAYFDTIFWSSNTFIQQVECLSILIRSHGFVTWLVPLNYNGIFADVWNSCWNSRLGKYSLSDTLQIHSICLNSSQFN